MRAIKIARIFNINIQLHYSWFFILFLLTWGLATGFFPQYYPDLTSQTYWMMSAVAAILLFVSVLLHELSHSLVAKARNIKVESITLFFFGGVAGITKEDIKPMSEFLMAMAGPIFSLVLGAIFYFLFVNNGNAFWTPITFYLYQLNFILAIFNLVPGFPLDGGRAFRAILHWYYKDLRKATKIASLGGRFFGGILVVFGFIGIFSGLGNGLWFVLIGGFLYFIAGMSYQQVVVREVLLHVPIKRLVNTKVATVSANLKFSDFAKQYNLEPYFLVESRAFKGILDPATFGKIPGSSTLGELAFPLSWGVQSNSSAYQAYRKFSEKKVDVLPVLKGKKFVGVITKSSLQRCLSWEMRKV